MFEGIILNIISNLFIVENKLTKEIYNCSSIGKFKTLDVFPIVGDNVIVEIVDRSKKIGSIKEITNRKVLIKRPKIANLTKLIFVISMKEPKPDLLMLDKQVAYAEFLNLKSVIVINKIDLASEELVEEITDIYEKIGYKVIKMSSKEDVGVEDLKLELIGNISAFSGNSGVGKSTIINSYFKKDIAKEGDISKKSSRGKNTTTSTSLYEVEKNSYIADTPRIFYI